MSSFLNDRLSQYYFFQKEINYRKFDLLKSTLKLKVISLRNKNVHVLYFNKLNSK